MSNNADLIRRLRAICLEAEAVLSALEDGRIVLDDEALSVRTSNWLLTYFPAVTWDELRTLTEDDLMRYPNTGRKMIKEIKEMLARHGYELAQAVPTSLPSVPAS